MNITTMPVEVVGKDILTHDLTISNENIATLIKAFVSNIYTNPKRTLLTEYLQNALDSHKAAKTRKHIEVYLPSTANPEYRVVDYGIGMDDEDIRNIISKICASGKRTDKYIGGFGIGFYSASAYTDNFTFIIRKNGQESIWAAAFGTGSGTFCRLAHNKTTKQNGVEVIIPIDHKDVAEFISIAKSELVYFKQKNVDVFVDGKKVDLYEEYEQITPTGYHHKNLIEPTVVLTVNGLVTQIISLSDILNKVEFISKEEKTILGIEHIWEFNYSLPLLHIVDLDVSEVTLSTNREAIILTNIQIARILKGIRGLFKYCQQSILDRIAPIKTRDELIHTYAAFSHLDYSVLSTFSEIRWKAAEKIQDILKLGSYKVTFLHRSDIFSWVWLNRHQYPVLATNVKFKIKGPKTVVTIDKDTVTIILPRRETYNLEVLTKFYKNIGANITIEDVSRERKPATLCIDRYGRIVRKQDWSKETIYEIVSKHISKTTFSIAMYEKGLHLLRSALSNGNIVLTTGHIEGAKSAQDVANDIYKQCNTPILKQYTRILSILRKRSNDIPVETLFAAAKLFKLGLTEEDITNCKQQVIALTKQFPDIDILAYLQTLFQFHSTSANQYEKNIYYLMLSDEVNMDFLTHILNFNPER